MTGSWTTWDTAEVLINLAAGENLVKFATVGDNDGPNIDQFDVTLVKADVVPAKDSAKSDSTVQDSLAFITMSAAVIQQGHYHVSLFDTRGSLVRRLEVEPSMLKDTAYLTRGLPAGIYVMRVKANDVERRSFVAVK